MPKILINDINMYYEIHGQGEPLVLITGFSADHTAWNMILEEFSKNYQVIVFDNRGAGQTDVPQGPYSIEQMADDVAALCEALSIKQANFVGNSMGGYILQALAYHHPNLVKSAVIGNSTFVTHTSFHFYVAAQLELIKANAPASALIKASCCWAFSYQFLSQKGIFDGLLEWGLNNPYPFTITGYEGQYAALNTFDSRNWAEKINVPTLVLSGDQDLIFNEPSVLALAKKIPGAEYCCFKDCGHLPQLEYPDRFVKIVSQFHQKI